MTGNTSLGPGREFDIVRSLFTRWGPLVRGAGDDAASLRVPRGHQLLISTDTSVEGVHFRRDWISPRDIGYRVVAVALSDLAAMAATPTAVLLAISAPERWLPDLNELADGAGVAVSLAGAHIVGGDLTASSELIVGVTVLGTTRHPVLRTGAVPGDLIYLTGTLGGPAAAAREWYAGGVPRDEWRDRYARPEPRLSEGRWFAAQGAHAMIDISDGLLDDATHLAHASGVRIAIDLDAIPVMDGVTRNEGAVSGDEYELLVAAPAGLDETEFLSRFGVALTTIGRVERGEPIVEATAGGKRVARQPGFSHFP